MYLGVENSLTGRRWVGPSEAIERDTLRLMQQTGYEEPLCRILARQGVTNTMADSYLSPKMRDFMPNPRHLKDCEQAARRIAQAITTNQKIAIFADYDVDGACSAALLHDFLGHYQLSPTLYVPDRINEGYGPNAAAIALLASSHDLIICVDCGTLSHQPLAAAQNTDVIVLDHHQGGETLPPALATVNPNRQDENFTLSHLCAAGVVFCVLVDVARQLRETNAQTPPDMLHSLDLVALATIADVCPLIGVNRAFVRQGLIVMARRQRVGLRALCDQVKLSQAPNAYHLGYVLGPRLNAGGRIGKADTAVRLLTAKTQEEANTFAQTLEIYNEKRRTLDVQITQEALAQYEAREKAQSPLCWAAAEGWHPGVLGIVAARLKEASGKASVVIGFDGDKGSGSGRSISGIDLGAAIQQLAQKGFIEKGGGHKMAAGLSLSRAQLMPAMQALEDVIATQKTAPVGPQKLQLDGLLYPSAAQIELIETLDKAGPFGHSAPAPLFAFADCFLKFAKPLSDQHLKITISDGVGHQLEGILFRAFETPLGATLQAGVGEKFHFAGYLELNEWNGRRRPQLRVEDAATV